MHPFLAPDFHIRWSTLVPEAVEPDIRHALILAKQNIEAICNQDHDSATYESTFLAFENASESLNDGWGLGAEADVLDDARLCNLESFIAQWPGASCRPFRCARASSPHGNDRSRPRRNCCATNTASW